MKVLISSYHNPNFINTSVYREKAFEYLGHELFVFDDRRFLVPGRIRQLLPAIEIWDLKRLNQALLKRIRDIKPDFYLSVGGQRILPETVKAIRDAGVSLALWTTDAPVDFKNILQSAPFYDHLFCAGSEACDIFIQNRFNNVTWLPFACDPAFHHPVELTKDDIQQFGRDVAFVGSYYPNRAKLLNIISDLNFGVWGPYWEKAADYPELLKKTISAKINYDQWVRIYSAAKITVVVHYQNPDVPCYQASPKLFEALACGAFVLVDRQKDAERLFKDGEHVVYFDDDKDLKEKVSYYLAHAEHRRRIAEQGLRCVREYHRYQDRIKQMLDIMQSIGRKKT